MLSLYLLLRSSPNLAFSTRQLGCGVNIAVFYSFHSAHRRKQTLFFTVVCTCEYRTTRLTVYNSSVSTTKLHISAAGVANKNHLLSWKPLLLLNSKLYIFVTSVHRTMLALKRILFCKRVKNIWFRLNNHCVHQFCWGSRHFCACVQRKFVRRQISWLQMITLR